MSSLSNSLDQTDRALLIHPYSNLVAHEQAGPLIISRGDGVRVYDVGGKEYIEGLGGLWSASLGFSEREIAEAVYEQMVQLPFYHGFHSKSTPSLIKLAHHLAEISPIPGAKFFFANSGSEINDTVIKCIWYANNVAGYPAKKKIITRNRSYHGVTIATASMTGLAANHSDFDLPIDRFLKVMCPDFYREGLEGESEEQFSDRCVAEVRDLIEREGADTIAAFVADPVIAGGGVLPPPKGYFEKLQPLLKENKILFVADEVICGFGRTGNMFATETYNLRPDIVTVAKALTASYIPMSAAMIAPSVWQPIVEGSRKHSVFAHGYTYSGHPVAAAAALKTLEIMEKRNIIGHVKTVAKVFASRLESYRGHPLVGDVRHVGLIGGIELVSNKATKAPFPVEVGTGAHCLRAAHKHGVILRSIGDIVAFCPPLIISEDEVDEMFSRFDRALDDTHAMLKGKELA